ncbi:MAG: hypothetical protein HS111_05355 [Kofleriaceae bacterium]|nr:hypothetical protein [Kofleriaceae bacterium]
MPSSSPARALWLVAGAIGLGGAIGATGAVARAEPSGGWAEPDPAAVVGAGAAPRAGAPASAPPGAGDARRRARWLGYAVDLAPVLDGLRPVVLVPMAARRLEAGLDELRVTWTTGAANQADARGPLRVGLHRHPAPDPRRHRGAGLRRAGRARSMRSPRRARAPPAPGLGDADRAAIAGAGAPARPGGGQQAVCAHARRCGRRWSRPAASRRRSRLVRLRCGCLSGDAPWPRSRAWPAASACRSRSSSGSRRDALAGARSSTVPAGDGAAEARPWPPPPASRRRGSIRGDHGRRRLSLSGDRDGDRDGARAAPPPACKRRGDNQELGP